MDHQVDTMSHARRSQGNNRSCSNSHNDSTSNSRRMQHSVHMDYSKDSLEGEISISDLVAMDASSMMIPTYHPPGDHGKKGILKQPKPNGAPPSPASPTSGNAFARTLSRKRFSTIRTRRNRARESLTIEELQEEHARNRRASSSSSSNTRGVRTTTSAAGRNNKSSSSSFHFGNDPEYEKEHIAQDERTAVRWFKAAIIVLFVVMMILSAYGMYTITKEERDADKSPDHDDYDYDHYYDYDFVEATIHQNLRNSFVALESLSVQTTVQTATAGDDGDTSAATGWPAVALNQFGVQASLALSLSGSTLRNVMLLPLVTATDRPRYQNFTFTNRDWLASSLEDGKDGIEETVFPTIFEYDGQTDERKPVESTTPSSSELHPLWQMSPIIPEWVNWHYAGLFTTTGSKMESIMLDSRIQFVSSLTGQGGVDIFDDDEDENDRIVVEQILRHLQQQQQQQQQKQQQSLPTDVLTTTLPFGRITAPVYQTIPDASKDEDPIIVGHYVSFLDWTRIFQPLPATTGTGTGTSTDSNTIHHHDDMLLRNYTAVVTNACTISTGDGHQTAIFEVSTDTVKYVGSNISSTENNRLADDDGSYIVELDTAFFATQRMSQIPFDDGKCPYIIRIHPAAAAASVHSRTGGDGISPILATSLVVIVFAIVISLFLAYDWWIRRRQKRILESAMESRAILSSMFPSAVMDRLLAQSRKAKSGMKLLFGSRRKLGDDNANGNTNGKMGNDIEGGNDDGTGRASPASKTGTATTSATSQNKRMSQNSLEGELAEDSATQEESNTSSNIAQNAISQRPPRPSVFSTHSSTTASTNMTTNRKSASGNNIMTSGLFSIASSGNNTNNNNNINSSNHSTSGSNHGRIYKQTERIQNFLTNSIRRSNGSSTHRSGSNHNSTSHDAARDRQKPIADLFPHVTVLFSDIAGFTSWASQREPEQVFILLENVYRAFDKLAKRRSVFKVETIGDCYVAATGLPVAQDDHAWRMVKFALECRARLNQVTRDLEVKLGPDTADLSMRFGLHSGPVTAGVLRGERSRFQLFGDTVNTASRMETTGERNRIHISQATADELIFCGKGAWIRRREKLVEAKGKGTVQTYWVASRPFQAKKLDKRQRRKSNSRDADTRSTKGTDDDDENIIKRNPSNTEGKSDEGDIDDNINDTDISKRDEGDRDDDVDADHDHHHHDDDDDSNHKSKKIRFSLSRNVESQLSERNLQRHGSNLEKVKSDKLRNAKNRTAAAENNNNNDDRSITLSSQNHNSFCNSLSDTDWQHSRDSAMEWGSKSENLDDDDDDENDFVLTAESGNASTMFQTPAESSPRNRFVMWQTDMLARSLKLILSRRLVGTMSQRALAIGEIPSLQERSGDVTVRDEYVKELKMPGFNRRVFVEQSDPNDVELSLTVMSQIRDFVATVAELYNDSNPYHNFEHASHVTLSANKFLNAVVVNESSLDMTDAMDLHHRTDGLNSDPLAQFAIIFSALIHDADHTGVPNPQAAREDPDTAELYRNQSIAEQKSVDLSWDLLMDDRYEEFRMCICPSSFELRRLRQLVVNCVMATDLFDPEFIKLRADRWEQVYPEADAWEAELHDDDHGNPRATIIIELIMQAADISHTMQHWHVYRKWNEKLFREMYQAFLDGRCEHPPSSDGNAPNAPTTTTTTSSSPSPPRAADPSIAWYQNELAFFDDVVIPVAQKLLRCEEVFGNTSNECLHNALQNRSEWESRGRDVVAEMVSNFRSSHDSRSEVTKTTDTASDYEGYGPNSSF